MADNGFAHLNGVKHIVWDWNGTLLDDNHANMAALNRVCAEFGREPVELDYWRGFFRRPLLSCYEELFGRSLADDEWTRLNRVYDDHYLTQLPSCALAEGVPAIFADWRARGIRLGHSHLLNGDQLIPSSGWILEPRTGAKTQTRKAGVVVAMSTSATGGGGRGRAKR